jgi:tRNA threonylcarbamoyladenosine biosynthesis protein TsaB
MLLAIDTATHIAGIALYDERGVCGATVWQTERNHTVELMPNIVALLAQAGTQPSHLQVIAVALGPGSYTGLRIGLSVAKGFCLAHGAALVGVPTLDISAHAYAPRDGILCALLQAGRGRLAAAFYHVVNVDWQALGNNFFGRAGELAAACSTQSTLFVGEVDAETELILRERLGERAMFAPPHERARDPRVLARLGWARWQCGERADVETLAPIYGQ